MNNKNNSIEKKHNRYWYQYRLKTLFVVVMIFSIGCSWFAVKLKQAKEQHQAVEAIAKAGGKVIYDYMIHDGEYYPESKIPGPAWLRKVFGDDLFISVSEVYISTVYFISALLSFWEASG